MIAITILGVALIAVGLVAMCAAAVLRDDEPADPAHDERAAAAALRPRGGEVLAAPRAAPLRNLAAASMTLADELDLIQAYMVRDGMRPERAAAEASLRQLEQRRHAGA